jgi:hypothetical protein
MSAGPPLKILSCAIFESQFKAKEKDVPPAFSNQKIITLIDGQSEAKAEGKIPDKENPYWLCRVTVESKNDKGALPCSFKVVMLGQFQVDPSFKGDHNKLVMITGASILYSAIRDYLLTISLRGPWPGVLLPAVAFSSPTPQTTISNGLEKPIEPSLTK